MKALPAQPRKPAPPAQNASVALHFLMEKHGPLVPAEDLREILHFRTPGAMDRSLRRGKLGIPMRRLPNRKGLYALAEDVAAYLDALPLATEEPIEDCPDESLGGEKER